MTASTNEIEQCQRDLDAAEAEVSTLTSKLKAAKVARDDYAKRLVKLKRSANKDGKDSVIRDTILRAAAGTTELTTRGILALFDGWNPVRVQSVLQRMVDAGDVVGLAGDKNSINYSPLERGTWVLIGIAAQRLGLSGMDELVKKTHEVVLERSLAGGKGLHHVDERRIVTGIVRMEKLGLLRVKTGVGGEEEGFFFFSPTRV